MIYLKFIKFCDGGERLETAISCPHFSAYEREWGYSIIVFKDMLETDGVERHISGEAQPGHYDSCFVMNDSGKTIDTYRAKPKS